LFIEYSIFSAKSQDVPGIFPVFSGREAGTRYSGAGIIDSV
jgi:hypothetical protein